ncbi:MAG: DNA polymerase III subunit beta [Candidatus Caenarcaniphilales bacterium]|nr:DNA polymerase III subunit beta [Candidatus Caenarcaniphilales bacterium]
MDSTTTVDTQNNLSVKLSQESFYHSINLVSRAVAKHGIQPVLNNIYLKATSSDKTLTIAATDLSLSIVSKVLCSEILEDGEITIPAQKILELTGKLPKQELDIKSLENGLIKVSCGRSKFDIKGLSSEQFPKDFLSLSTEESKCFKLPTKLLAEATRLVSFASDKREVNSILNGICLEISQNGVEIAATDGSRLAYFKVSETKFEEAVKVIIPFRAITELSRTITGIEEEEIECFIHNSSQIEFKTSDKNLITSLIDGSYPKYQQLIPQNHNQKAVLNRATFLAALDRVSVLANERTKVIKLLFEEIGILNLSANTPDLGDAQDQMDISEYKGQDFSIAFNVNYMSECLKNLDCENVELTMSEPLNPIILSPIFRDPDSDEPSSKAEYEYLYLLMPVQMKTGN